VREGLDGLTQAGAEIGRPDVERVRVGREDVRPAPLEQRLRGAPVEAPRGHLDEHALLDQRADQLRALLHGRVALGVGERDPEAAGGELEQARLEVAGQRAVGRLDQQVAAVAAERGEPQLGVVQLRRAPQVDLGARQDVDRQAAAAQVLGQLARPARDLVQPHVGMVVADVRRGDQRARARVRGDLGDRDGRGQRGRPVVEARQHVRVQVDHAADHGARRRR
jgi:hypothetical protein